MNNAMSRPADEGKPKLTPAQGKPAMADTEPPPDAQVGFGDDAAGAVGSPAPPPDEATSEFGDDGSTDRR